MDNYKSYVWKSGKLFIFLLFFFVIQSVFFPNPQQDEWRVLPPETLRASSQAEVIQFVNSYGIDDDSFKEVLAPLGFTLDYFNKVVNLSFMLDFPSDNRYGVTLVFKTEIEHEKISPAYTYITNDFRQKFHKAVSDNLIKEEAERL